MRVLFGSGALPDLKWPAHEHCLVCGPHNRRGLGLRFLPCDKCRVAACTRVVSTLQGYSGIVQGGVTAALLDSAMVHCIFRYAGVEAVTVEMSVRYVAEIAVGQSIRIEGCLCKHRKNVFWAEAKVCAGDCLLATATGTFMRRMPPPLQAAS